MRSASRRARSWAITCPIARLARSSESNSGMPAAASTGAARDALPAPSQQATTGLVTRRSATTVASAVAAACRSMIAVGA